MRSRRKEAVKLGRGTEWNAGRKLEKVRRGIKM
jgi:hypothetical protein